MTPIHHGNGLDCHEWIIANDGTITENTNNVSGKTFREYVEAIKQIAAFYSLPVIDAYAESGLNSVIISTDFSDGLHLNDAGSEKLAKWMRPHLEDIYEMFY